MSLVCLLACSAGLNAMATADLTSQEAPAAPVRRVRLDVTATLNGAPVGEIAIETDGASPASVDLARLITLLDGIVPSSTLATLRARAPGMVPLSELALGSITVVFDQAALRLNIAVPLEARAVNDLQVVSRSQFRQGGLTAPEPFSAGITITAGQRFRHTSRFSDLDRDPFDLVAEGFVNIGGLEGVYLAFQGSYREGEALTRQRVTLFHDDVDNAIRYSAGDVDPQVFGAYSAPAGVIGVSVERLYQTIQPFRNLRPAGRGSLIIERPSRVDVLVNGTLYRTLDLAPGQYNIRDFPSLEGLNDVQLVVRDDAGRDETITLSFFSDIDLLDREVSIFSATLGFRRTRFGQFRTTAYEEEPFFSGFYLRGVSDRLTLGAGIQLDQRNALLSGQAVVATPIGIIGLEGAVDFNENEDPQSAFTLSYRVNHPAAGNRVAGLNLDIQYQSAKFTPMDVSGPGINRFSWTLSARYQTPIDERTYLSITGGYSISRNPTLPDVRTAGASATRRFGPFNATAAYSYRDDERGREHRGVLSISLPLGSRRSARASYDTERHRVSADYQMIGLEGLNQTDVRVGAAASEDGHAANLEVEHYSNRFRAGLRHSYERSQGNVQQTTDLSASFGIGFADGRLAIGRDAARGFVIVDRHRSLGNADVIVSDSFSLNGTARTDALGPALVPVRRAYQPTTLEIDVPRLPTGYDIGPGRYDILPGAASGYSITIGSAASKTVLGRLINAGGEPLIFAAGTLEPVSGQPGESVQFFTNRTGRMAASRVTPGRYRIVLAGQSGSIGEINVPEDGEAVVNIGELRVGEPR